MPWALKAILPEGAPMFVIIRAASGKCLTFWMSSWEEMGSSDLFVYV